MLERYGHGGDIRSAEEVFGKPREPFIDFSSNMNPWGPPPVVKSIFFNSWQDIVKYPDPAVRELRAKLADTYRIPVESILVGNGAAELIDLVVRVLQPGVTGLVRPSFSEYEEAVQKINGQIYHVLLHAELDFELQLTDVVLAMDHADVLFVGHPNNPTGRLIPQPVLEHIISNQKPLILDEAFIDFTSEEENTSFIRQAARSKDLYVIRSMTKFYAIPGIRLGFIVAHPEMIQRLKSLQVQWSVNYLGQVIGAAVLEDLEYANKTRNWLVEERAWLTAQLKMLNLKVFPSDTNFLLFSFPAKEGLNVKSMQRRLGYQGILIRDASLFGGLDESYCRVAVRLRADNERLISELKRGGEWHG
jgi:threonine-phosphate decarboxylase